MKSIQILAAFAALSGCSNVSNSKEAETVDVDAQAREAWWRCVFELDKVEAIRGKNLDDLNTRGSVARNQFMMDCVTAEGATLTPELLQEMNEYAAQAGRAPTDISLNSGTRKLPGDESTAR